MEINKIKEELCGLNNGKPKASIGLMYCLPFQNEDDPETYDMEISDLVTMRKPEVNLTFITDPLHNAEFLQVELIFQSTYDPDIQEFFNILSEYKKNVDDNFDTPETCPGLSLLLIPAEVDAENPYYMQMDMPMMTGLTSSRQNKMPDTISMLFLLSECSIVENAPVDMQEIETEIKMERETAERERFYQEQAVLAEQKRLEKEEDRLKKLREQAAQMERAKDHTIRVGRGNDKSQ